MARPSRGYWQTFQDADDGLLDSIDPRWLTAACAESQPGTGPTPFQFEIELDQSMLDQIVSTLRKDRCATTESEE